ncbi:hypothetical protein CKO28_02850 [Rhodovibrio sodomensis]|uniref:Uncharacterized protein n=1 Tax=Rhodovibrio sodomensis TaxID=1088 RepID=A0ABS1DAQ0_9PROT|nr:hypothetical protein [Rhodovibrio sodomensis]MBK1666981.1 hypothetical protein [Rhodovibrio sodomensis]
MTYECNRKIADSILELPPLPAHMSDHGAPTVVSRRLAEVTGLVTLKLILRAVPRIRTILFGWGRLVQESALTSGALLCDDATKALVVDRSPSGALVGLGFFDASSPGRDGLLLLLRAKGRVRPDDLREEQLRTIALRRIPRPDPWITSADREGAPLAFPARRLASIMNKPKDRLFSFTDADMLFQVDLHGVEAEIAARPFLTPSDARECALSSAVQEFAQVQISPRDLEEFADALAWAPRQTDLVLSRMQAA